MQKSISQKFSIEFKYDILFSRNIFSKENLTLSQILLAEEFEIKKKVAFIIDSEVHRCHPSLIEQIKVYFKALDSRFDLLENFLIVKGGEDVKNDLADLKRVLDLIDAQKIDRHSYIIAIGGGAVLDMSGFAAAIGHRGIRHIRIPSTVLSQNDSGVGVKNGVNYFGKKNFLGTFVPPYAVINDSTFLTTLGDRDWIAGIAEAIKVALIKDNSFFEWLVENRSELVKRDLAKMETLIYRCAQYHIQHIAAAGDPFEIGSSRPLDFGHWSAHKLEQLSNYHIKHGEAVAIGMALDVIYSQLTGSLSIQDSHRIIKAIQDLGFKTFHSLLLSPDGKKINSKVLDGLEEFREHLGGKLTIMLLNRIGKGYEVNEMDPDCIELAALELARY